MTTLTFTTTLGKFIEERKELLENLAINLETNEANISGLRILHDDAVAKFESDYASHIERFSSDIVKNFKRDAISHLVTKIRDNSLFGKLMVYLGDLLGDKTRFIRNYTCMLSEELYNISHRYSSINVIMKIETIADFSNIDEYSCKFLHEYKFENFNNFLISHGIPPVDIDEHISNIHTLHSDIEKCEVTIREILCEINKIATDIKTFDMPCYYENECTISMDSSGNCSVNIK
jgi:hypothetical protein